jgi:hypothetical protein
MAKNGISTLATKELRQIAKLNLAQTKRQLVGTAGYRTNRYYDVHLLPTSYDGNSVVNNTNEGGLQPHRPWKSTPNIELGLWRSIYTGYFDDDWTWFDNHNILDEAAAANFNLNPFSGNTDTSFQWIGYFLAPHTANYTFWLYSDDVSIFWIGDKAITGYDDSNWDVYTNAGQGETGSDPIALTAGQYYPIRVQYGNGSGEGYFNFSWSDDYVGPFPTYERVENSGATINTEQTAAFKLTIQSSSFQVEPHVNGQIGINDILTVDVSSRGHTVLAMQPDGTVIEQVTYDTYEPSSGSPLSDMNTALQGYAVGTVVAICSYDACSLDVIVRATLNTSYGGTLTDTWLPTRYSHIFIGQKV